jgi:undecaprenyl diphosphate synthase
MTASIPRHVALIPDGNRRWAKSKGLTTFAGHQKGIQAFEEIAQHAAERGIEHVSLWGLSVDNLTKRSPAEVAGLLKIFREEFAKLTESESIHQQETKIRVLGQWQKKFPLPVKRAIEAAIAATSGYRQHNLNFFLAYNGTDEMLQAVKTLVNEARRVPKVQVTARLLKQHLLTRDLPPVDLLIRTGGEPHLSAGFMMWDIADAQLYFTKALWPEFTTQLFDEALAEYAVRERRFGA